MKFLYTTDGNGSLTVTRHYEPGEKYISSYIWDRKLGRPTRELVEQLLKGCRFVEIVTDRFLDPNTFRTKSMTLVRVERIAV